MPAPAYDCQARTGLQQVRRREQKKVKEILPQRPILYDPNRCIMCTRCVRFTDEVTKTGSWVRREGSEKDRRIPGKNLDNELSGNVTDLCPVGAPQQDNLHEERVWYWKFTESVCTPAAPDATSRSASTPGRGRCRG
jgi:NADH-quinone oxidoreductase subunit G